jgi:hypothetical protein
MKTRKATNGIPLDRRGSSRFAPLPQFVDMRERARAGGKGRTGAAAAGPLLYELRRRLATADQTRVGNIVDGMLPSSRAGRAPTDSEKRLVAIYGMLVLDGIDDPARSDFARALMRAQIVYAKHKVHFERALATILAAGGKLAARRWVRQARALIKAAARTSSSTISPAGAPRKRATASPATAVASHGGGGQTMQPTFLDLKDRNEAERKRLCELRATHKERFPAKDADGKPIPRPKAIQAEIDRIDKLLNSNCGFRDGVKVVDPLFQFVRKTLTDVGVDDIADHDKGKFPGQSLTNPQRTLTGVYGILEKDGQDRIEGLEKSPALDKIDHNPKDPTEFPRLLAALQRDELSHLVPGVTSALGRYTRDKQLFTEVLDELRPETKDKIGCRQLAEVVLDLRGGGIKAGDDQLGLRAEVALERHVDLEPTAGPPSTISIDLPDLDAESSAEIIQDNLKGVKMLYFASMLEEVKLFQVADKLLELFQGGMLPFGRGSAGDKLYKYWRKSINRMSEIERRNLYMRVFGFPGGDTMQGAPNREFTDLWLRFLSAVSSFVRQVTVDDLLRSRIPNSVSEELVRKSGRDLAANLSLHGYGIAYFAGTELQEHINDVLALLNDQEIKAAYGARDMWQVVEQVSALELGGTRNIVRHRTMAQTGAVIVAWLTTRAAKLSSSVPVSVIDQNAIRFNTRPDGVKATENPSDKDLYDAAEQWLAVTGTSDTRVEEFAQPIESAITPTRPVQIPQIARDLLESVGVQAGVGGNGAGQAIAGNRIAQHR